MPSHRLTDNEIAIRVCAKRLRWPKRGTAIVWTKAHDCVDALQDLVRSVDTACIEVEQSRELSPGAIARRRAEVCDQALSKLVNFSAFEIAENALSENIVALERLSNRDPEQVQMLQKLTQALHDLPEGIDTTRRMLLERCKNAGGRATINLV
jgi:hypothetical protein